MATARHDLIESINGVRNAAHDAVLQRAAPIPANNEINKMAELLRRGLYVVAFNAIEDYLKRRATEHLTKLSSITTLDFDQLPPGLQKAAILDALKNGIREAGYDKANQYQIIRTVAGAVASTDSRQQYNIHEYSVLRSGSNVSPQDISSALGALYIDNPWNQMQQFLDFIGNVGAPILARFETCGIKRNAAAHGGQAIEFSDLLEIADLALPLASAFDLMFSAGMTRLADNTPTLASTSRVRPASSIDVNFVGIRNSDWCRLRRDKKVFRRFPSKNGAVQNALKSLSTTGAVIELGPRGEITDWHLADQRLPHP